MEEDNILMFTSVPEEHEDEPECFARIDRTHCNALNDKDCRYCPFFKSRSEIKNNPYYGYSYKTAEEHEKAMKEHKIDTDDVIY